MKMYKKGNTPTDGSSVAYVGRGSEWGNPYRIGTHGSRREVIEKFTSYAIDRLKREPDWLDPLKDFDGLVCYCVPLPCHGDVIINLLTKEGETE